MYRVPKQGGPPSTLVTQTRDEGIDNLCAQGDHLYYVRRYFSSAAEPVGEVVDLDLTTGLARPIEPSHGNARQVVGLACDEAAVYWTTVGKAVDPQPDVRRTDRKTGATQVLWSQPTGAFLSPVFASGSLYLGHQLFERHTLMQLTIDASPRPPSVLVELGAGWLSSLTESEGDLIAALTEQDGSVGGVQTLAAGRLGTVWNRGPATAVAANHNFIYWTAPLAEGDRNRAGNVYRARRDGSEVMALAPTEAFPNSIVLDEKWVYYAFSGRERIGQKLGGIRRVPQ